MQTCLLRSVLLACVLTWTGYSSIEETCAAHELGRNCSSVRGAASARAVRRAGCAGLHTAYTAALLSGAAYLEWGAMATDIADFPRSIPFEFGPCRSKPVVKTIASLALLSEWRRSLLGTFQRMFYLITPAMVAQMPKTFINITKSAIIFFTKFLSMVLGSKASPRERRSLTADEKRRRYGVVRNVITPVWFFSDWKDGYWHDTEVLIASSSTVMYVIFRGSDSPADAMTSSQTYIPARNVDRFRDLNVGSFHRGILNAYSRVNSGHILYLKEDSDYADEAWGPHMNPFLKVFHNAFQICHGDGNRSLADSDPPDSRLDSKYFRGSKCRASNQNLADILLKAVAAGVSSGLKVVVSGHSLGGGLATMLALDVLLNGIDHSRAYKGGDMTDPTTEPYYEWIYEAAEHATNAAKAKAKAEGNDYRYDDEFPANNLYLITFGDPEIADALLFDHLPTAFPHVGIEQFSRNNYLRFVSVSKSPHCKMDVVTGSMTLANSFFGDIVMGKGGGFWGRVKARADQRLAQQPPAQAQAREQQYIHGALTAAYDPSLRRAPAHGSATDTALLGRHLGDSYAMRGGETTPRGFVSNVPKHDVQPDTQGYIHDPIYVSSGHASSSFAAHSVIHYIQGLTRVLNSNNNIVCDYSYAEKYYGSAINQELNMTFLQDNNCSRCYMACGLHANTLDKVLYPSGGCRLYDGDGLYFTLAC
jgi:hypothetical protein